MGTKVLSEQEAMDIFRMLEFDEVKESFTDCFYNTKKDCYEYDERTAFQFLYDVANYDMISLYGGTINVEESNHPELAKVLKDMYSKEIVSQVYERLYY